VSDLRHEVLQLQRLDQVGVPGGGAVRNLKVMVMVMMMMLVMVMVMIMVIVMVVRSVVLKGYQGH
jgi:hypothetical protein